MSLIFVNFLTSIPEFISSAVEKNSVIAYLTICLAMFLENIIPPIPSEIIMPLGGFFVYQQKLNFYFLVFWGLLGTILGSLPWYYLGRLVNEKRLSSFLDKKGKYLGISSKDLKKSKSWFDKYGVSLVFWGRLVPGIRTLISVPAGIELMPLRKFLIWTAFGSFIWVALLTYAGYLFGENYPIIETYLDQIKYVVKPVLILIFLYFFIRFTIRFLKNKG
ncbi:DedA family protein [Prochlorococcus marinus XMU1410]|uniref:DedA family protein n=1 Tax=Prochlorococcus marinus TaxID=1219 RepID=UPI001AD9E3C2|nr:DedA family protein [Prochlorococcus marinus]MBO8242765.1 DedA family protein [Prochlorococcus marinus XMU1410]MBW3053886.1 alkaline phosphatase [Prochlorococcus marinus str. MU1410]